MLSNHNKIYLWVCERSSWVLDGGMVGPVPLGLQGLRPGPASTRTFLKQMHYTKIHSFIAKKPFVEIILCLYFSQHHFCSPTLNVLFTNIDLFNKRAAPLQWKRKVCSSHSREYLNLKDNYRAHLHNMKSSETLIPLNVWPWWIKLVSWWSSSDPIKVTQQRKLQH